jgi:hypothetical protein
MNEHIDDSSPATCSALVIAFVQGAAWWEYHQTKSTMWQSDRRLSEEEATRREHNGTLGVLPNDIICDNNDKSIGKNANNGVVETVDSINNKH